MFVVGVAGMKAAEVDSTGVHNVSLWADATAVGSSAVINAGLTELLKHSIHEMRPDRSGNDSWPSRHTSWAFAIGGSVGLRAARYSGWWTVAAHTAANVVAMERCHSQRHFPKDVLGGAATGLVSVAAGEVLSRLIFGGQSPVLYTGTTPSRESVDAFTTALLTGGRSGAYCVRTGVRSGLRYNLPLGQLWGVSAEASVSYLPVYEDGVFDQEILRGGVAVGPWIRHSIGACSLEGRAMLGAQRNAHQYYAGWHAWAVTWGVNGAALWNVARTCALGVQAGYEGRSCGLGRNCATVSAVSRVMF